MLRITFDQMNLIKGDTLLASRIMQKVAAITAGGSGMGAVAARRLAADGFLVAILSSSCKGQAPG